MKNTVVKNRVMKKLLIAIGLLSLSLMFLAPAFTSLNREHPEPSRVSEH